MKIRAYGFFFAVALNFSSRMDKYEYAGPFNSYIIRLKVHE